MSILALLFCLAILALSGGALAAEQVLRRGLGPEPDSLHIHQAQGLAAINVLRDLREGLTTFDASGEVAPGVAIRWERSNDGLNYRFELREDARWSDGSPVKPGDFVRAWRRALDPATAAVTATLLLDLDKADEIHRGDAPADSLGVREVAPRILELSLARPVPWLPELLAHPVSYPLHENAVDDALRAPVNGAYMLEQWEPRSLIRLRRNPHFHAAAEVQAEVVEYFPIEEPASELARFRAGELDITETIPAGRYDWLRQNMAEQLRVSPYLGSFWLGINLRDPVLGQSAGLRRALALAIDREKLVEIVLGAGELPAWSVVPPGTRPGDSAYSVQKLAGWDLSQAEREAEARRLLEAAGFTHRKPTLQLRYNTSAIHRRVAIAVAAMWKQVLGIGTELVNEEWKVFVNNRRLGRVTQVFRGGWIADYADPSSFLDLFRSGSELNTTFLSDSEFDQLLHRAGGSSGIERTRLLQAAEQRLLSQTPVIPLYYYVSRHLVDTDVTGFENNIRDIHLSRYLGRRPADNSP